MELIFILVALAITGMWIFQELFRSAWLLSMVYGIRQGSKLLAGDRGIVLGRQGLIDREHLQEVVWDRDIRQQQWGATVTFNRAGRAVRQRLYVHRDLKPRVESLLGPR
jgi:hypothetical protein